MYKIKTPMAFATINLPSPSFLAKPFYLVHLLLRTKTKLLYSYLLRVPLEDY